MRKFLSSTAGASFNQEVATQTICVRKAAIKREESHARMSYPKREQARPKVKDCVELIYKVKPTLYAVMTGDDADGVYECECRPDGTMYHGFALKVEVPKGLAILECITPEIFSKGRLLANKCLKMYAELYDNPPFPAWKDGLDEVWN